MASYLVVVQSRTANYSKQCLLHAHYAPRPGQYSKAHQAPPSRRPYACDLCSAFRIACAAYYPQVATNQKVYWQFPHDNFLFSVCAYMCKCISVCENVSNVFQTCEFGKINENSTENKCKNRKKQHTHYIYTYTQWIYFWFIINGTQPMRNENSVKRLNENSREQIICIPFNCTVFKRKYMHYKKNIFSMYCGCYVPYLYVISGTLKIPING